MTPYYEDDAVTLYHGDAREFLPTLAPQSVDCVITDPPYTERTHGMAKTNKGKGHGTKAITFAPFTDADLLAALTDCGRVTRRWVVASLDYAHAFQIDAAPPPGLRSLRVGVWVKPNPMPQISADRPGQGWEAISFLHRVDVKPSWNGGGKAGVWIHPVAQNEGHATVKPLPMVADWVRLFTGTATTPSCESLSAVTRAKGTTSCSTTAGRPTHGAQRAATAAGEAGVATRTGTKERIYFSPACIAEDGGLFDLLGEGA